ncbi:hypothetical protein LRS06_16500 [Hymenobacter sp. J193]|uniref:hypothetical protein n=1 Tax=Hymenobacter sp. J193 TaxID=2898429 RepID=UPI0021511DB4|nr:hypothetical protein [Hymenobacter sp. J193]MCR5889337.1 hypothetical protein [Hymenobacter sp. J193]
MPFLRSLLSIRYYALVALLVYGVFVWANATSTRLLGDDNEAPANARGNGLRGGRTHFYHK